jgi:hypothetical protein
VGVYNRRVECDCDQEKNKAILMVSFILLLFFVLVVGGDGVVVILFLVDSYLTKSNKFFLNFSSLSLFFFHFAQLKDSRRY